MVSTAKGHYEIIRSTNSTTVCLDGCPTESLGRELTKHVLDYLERNHMKVIKTLTELTFAVALMLGTSTALASQSCCVKAKAKGKECDHECCVKAHKAHKLCEKCQKEATCCDKAIAQGKECSHPCCKEAVKEHKICEKCNTSEEKKK